MIVPEDRTKNPSHTIKLAYVVYHSTNPNPAPDPVLFLQGGPGGEAISLSVNDYHTFVAPFLPERDLIVFDQRGTGESEPALNCDELTKVYQQDIHGLIPSTTRKLVYSNAFLSCSGLMKSEGISLNAYTTVASAADIKDLISLLGYQQVDLYSVSYGTRLAQVVMRDYPKIVHSAILDSVVPIETNMFSMYPNDIDASLKTLFDGCTADPECNAAYPQLGNVFWSLVSELDTNPVSITTSDLKMGTITESINGSSFLSVILGLLKSADLIATAPQSIYRFKNGDYSTFITAQSSLPFVFDGISPGLYISMMCHEQILAATPEELQAAMVNGPDVKDYAWLPFYGDANDLFNECESWGSVGPSAGENDPAMSDIPTLVVAGKYDSATPPSLSQQVASHLSHSYYFEFPNQGHAPTFEDSSGCGMDIILSFLQNPAVEPDHSCLSKIKDPHFLVPYTGTPVLPLETAQVAGVLDKVPKGWLSFQDGVYLRADSPIDITQAAIFQTYANSTELENWFSSKLYDYHGLDSAPAATGQRQANGLTWTLYTSTSDGRPVDIAMADYHGRSLVVTLFCSSDEHDALYQTVFLPMIDSAQP